MGQRASATVAPEPYDVPKHLNARTENKHENEETAVDHVPVSGHHNKSSTTEYNSETGTPAHRALESVVNVSNRRSGILHRGTARVPHQQRRYSSHEFLPSDITQLSPGGSENSLASSSTSSVESQKSLDSRLHRTGIVGTANTYRKKDFKSAIPVRIPPSQNNSGGELITSEKRSASTSAPELADSNKKQKQKDIIAAVTQRLYPKRKGVDVSTSTNGNDSPSRDHESSPLEQPPQSSVRSPNLRDISRRLLLAHRNRSLYRSEAQTQTDKECREVSVGTDKITPPAQPIRAYLASNVYVPNVYLHPCNILNEPIELYASVKSDFLAPSRSCESVAATSSPCSNLAHSASGELPTILTRHYFSEDDCFSDDSLEIKRDIESDSLDSNLDKPCLWKVVNLSSGKNFLGMTSSGSNSTVHSPAPSLGTLAAQSQEKLNQNVTIHGEIANDEDWEVSVSINGASEADSTSVNLKICSESSQEDCTLICKDKPSHSQSEDSENSARAVSSDDNISCPSPGSSVAESSASDTSSSGEDFVYYMQQTPDEVSTCARKLYTIAENSEQSDHSENWDVLESRLPLETLNHQRHSALATCINNNEHFFSNKNAHSDTSSNQTTDVQEFHTHSDSVSDVLYSTIPESVVTVTGVTCKSQPTHAITLPTSTLLRTPLCSVRENIMRYPLENVYLPLHSPILVSRSPSPGLEDCYAESAEPSSPKSCDDPKPSSPKIELNAFKNNGQLNSHLNPSMCSSGLNKNNNLHSMSNPLTTEVNISMRSPVTPFSKDLINDNQHCLKSISSYSPHIASIIPAIPHMNGLPIAQWNQANSFSTKLAQTHVLKAVDKSAAPSATLLQESNRVEPNLRPISSDKYGSVQWADPRHRNFLNVSVVEPTRAVPATVGLQTEGYSTASEDSITYVYVGPAQRHAPPVLLELVRRSVGGRGLQRSVSLDSATRALSRLSQRRRGDVVRACSMDTLLPEETHAFLEPARRERGPREKNVESEKHKVRFSPRETSPISNCSDQTQGCKSVVPPTARSHASYSRYTSDSATPRSTDDEFDDTTAPEFPRITGINATREQGGKWEEIKGLVLGRPFVPSYSPPLIRKNKSVGKKAVSWSDISGCGLLNSPSTHSLPSSNVLGKLPRPIIKKTFYLSPEPNQPPITLPNTKSSSFCDRREFLKLDIRKSCNNVASDKSHQSEASNEFTYAGNCVNNNHRGALEYTSHRKRSASAPSSPIQEPLWYSRLQEQIPSLVETTCNTNFRSPSLSEPETPRSGSPYDTFSDSLRRSRSPPRCASESRCHSVGDVRELGREAESMKLFLAQATNLLHSLNDLSRLLEQNGPVRTTTQAPSRQRSLERAVQTENTRACACSSCAMRTCTNCCETQRFFTSHCHNLMSVCHHKRTCDSCTAPLCLQDSFGHSSSTPCQSLCSSCTRVRELKCHHTFRHSHAVDACCCHACRKQNCFVCSTKPLRNYEYERSSLERQLEASCAILEASISQPTEWDRFGEDDWSPQSDENGMPNEPLVRPNTRPRSSVTSRSTWQNSAPAVLPPLPPRASFRPHFSPRAYMRHLLGVRRRIIQEARHDRETSPKDAE